MCPDCATEICFTCHKKHHPGYSCISNFDLEVDNEEIQMCEKCNTKVYRLQNNVAKSERNKMTCPQCDYSWCWDCNEKFEEGHGWMCNPFGLNIKKNSVMRNKCVFYLLRVIYIIILVILIPILILFFIPCKLAFMVGHATNDAIDNLFDQKNRDDAYM